MSEQSSVMPVVMLILYLISWPVGLYLTVSGAYKYKKYQKLGEVSNSKLIKKSRNKVIIGIFAYSVPVIVDIIYKNFTK